VLRKEHISIKIMGSNKTQFWEKSASSALTDLTVKYFIILVIINEEYKQQEKFIIGKWKSSESNT